MNRRELMLTTAGAAIAATAIDRPAVAQERIKKAVVWSMLPGNMSIDDRFKLCRDCGFDGVEAPPITDPAQCEAMRAGAEKAGQRVHSVIFGGWNPTLTDPDPAKREQAFELTKKGLHGAKLMGADCILLVPGVVNEKVRYAEAWERSSDAIKRLIPTAKELKVAINVEEVWNNFLLSPVEFANYVDSFKSPWVQAYFDVGNVVTFGWPEDWIRTLGKRIKKVHIKDYKGGPGLFGGNKGTFVNIRDGSVNWPEVHKAFNEIGYKGWMTLELGGGDEAYLKDVSKRFDLIIEGK